MKNHSVSKAGPSCRAVPGGFTLIEVLVVVAIIALLLAVLMPSLAQARASARAAVCSSNIHQFGIALQMYETESRGYIPRGGTQTSQHWVMLVARHIGDKRKYEHVEQVPVEKDAIYSCPERVRSLPTPYIDYVINAMPSDLKHGQTRELDEPTRSSVWKHPSRILLLGDTAFEAGYTTFQDGASTDPDLRESRENHERAKQWVLGTPFNESTMGSLSRMDFFHLAADPPWRQQNAPAQLHQLARGRYARGKDALVERNAAVQGVAATVRHSGPQSGLLLG